MEAYALLLLPRTGRLLRDVAVGSLLAFVLYQVNRITDGDPFGLPGFAYGLTLAILLLLPSTGALLRHRDR